MKKEKVIKYSLILASVLISIVIIYFRNELAKLSSLGYFGLFLINAIGSATILVPMPAVLATFVGGSIYNPILAGIVSGVGAALGETTGYLAGFGGSAFIKENKNYIRIEKWMGINGFLTLFVLACIPNPIFDLTGMFAGATKYSFKRYLLAITLGKTLRFVGIALLGSGFIK